MSVVDVERLSATERLALLETLRAEMARGTDYQETPVGREVKRYLDDLHWKSIAAHTIANREGPLRLLALETVLDDGKPRAVTLADLDGRQGGKLVAAFLMREWGKTADNTRANRTGVLRSFFSWAYREGLIDKNPMEFVETPKRRGRRRDAHPKDEVMRLIAAQPQWRDRLAIALMARQALRKSELAGVQLGHLDFANRSLAIFGKGSKYNIVSLFPDLAADLERYVQERAFDNPNGWRSEHLVFPRKVYKRGSWPNYTWHEKLLRDRPLSSNALQAWWRDCLERASLPPFPMHELRHTAGTDFHNGPAKGDYELTRQFLRHEDVSTTAGYVHSPSTQVARVVGDTPDYWSEEA